ncbi:MULTISPECIES: hypothetical protein [Gracilibacillus]|jgi:hypothetical protein|nr:MULTISPECIES: hypothetical protein [Gracilibacillus]
MEVVLTIIGLAVGIMVACINLVTAIMNFKRHKKKDHRSAKR